MAEPECRAECLQEAECINTAEPRGTLKAIAELRGKKDKPAGEKSLAGFFIAI